MAVTLDPVWPFLQTWGSLIVSFAALLLSLDTRRKQNAEFAWKKEDREREAVRRKKEEERKAWCEEMCRALKEQPGGGGILVPDDKREWALWGDSSFFRVRPHPTNNNLYLFVLGR